MRLKLISCDIFERELQVACAQSSNHVDVDFLTQAPHQLSEHEMLACIQTRIDRVDRSAHHAVLLVAGSCKHGLTGLRARSIPLVLPRARDCISLLLEKHPPLTAAAASSRAPAKCGPNLAEAEDSPAFWMAPVHTPVVKPKPAWSRLEYPFRLSQRRCAAAPRPAPKQSGPGRHRSILEMLVEGYWNYADFLVVPPGWQVIVRQPQGTIAAQELSS